MICQETEARVNKQSVTVGQTFPCSLTGVVCSHPRKADLPLPYQINCGQMTERKSDSQTYNGILVPVRISFGLRWRSGKTYNVST